MVLTVCTWEDRRIRGEPSSATKVIYINVSRKHIPCPSFPPIPEVFLAKTLRIRANEIACIPVQRPAHTQCSQAWAQGFVRAEKNKRKPSGPSPHWRLAFPLPSEATHSIQTPGRPSLSVSRGTRSCRQGRGRGPGGIGCVRTTSSSHQQEQQHPEIRLLCFMEKRRQCRCLRGSQLPRFGNTSLSCVTVLFSSLQFRCKGGNSTSPLFIGVH